MIIRPEIEPYITIRPETEPRVTMRPEIEPHTTIRPETEPHISHEARDRARHDHYKARDRAATHKTEAAAWQQNGPRGSGSGRTISWGGSDCE